MHLWSKLSSAKWRDAWEERFHALEDTGLVLTDFPGRNTLRIEVYCKTKRKADAIQREFGGTVRHLPNRDWVAAAPPDIAPVKIRNRFVITPATDPADVEALRRQHPGRTVLHIPARMAFGTGDHATTATCLRLLCDLHQRGDLPNPFSCLDLGCGTGILALAAHALGASPVHAYDFDPSAITIARDNLRLNHVPPRTLLLARTDVLKWQPDRRFDLVFANLFSDILAQAFPSIRAALTPHGHLIASGILHSHAPDCLAAASRAGLTVLSQSRRGKWVTALAQPTPTSLQDGSL